MKGVVAALNQSPREARRQLCIDEKARHSCGSNNRVIDSLGAVSERRRDVCLSDIGKIYNYILGLHSGGQHLHNIDNPDSCPANTRASAANAGIADDAARY